ncbi:NADH-quinone oxidoreductase subunit E [Jannaschia pagri]|uniref:NADH-quinone oxidoreductase subunit E n=1 Tax=Jannaschia pagri TaxID=2829797 RepID=A0ABQ4NQR8_9RHOB|nr:MULTISPECIES: NADH-quinone oxidoreductase subunit E [unclassified Jannaschia]GIT92910.1 NADH-quinone oxidoreductase subunit E [Jannaschia sp. AI_61]GIT96745.1 NADH-quinone oxidoreductase subunit E [Jannaschia sp. AI_62]
MLRRLHKDQPESFAFTPANQAWAEAQITKYPEGRQASAVIPLLWRAQEQEGWLTRPAMEHVAEMLGMAYIRVLEVATFYFMFQLQPVGSVAHIQICGTTSCMICGAEDLVAVCKDKIAKRAHEISEDGKLSWEEVECLGACANAPMAQIGKDYYEDLTAERFSEMLDEFRAGEVPVPGPQNGRYTSEPLGGATSLTDHAAQPDHSQNASVALATGIGDTVKRIDGTEVPLRAPWQGADAADANPVAAERDPLLPPSGPDGNQAGRVAGDDPAPRDRGDASDGVANVRGSDAEAIGTPEEGTVAPDESAATPSEADRPAALEAARDGEADDLKRIKGIGPKLEKLCNTMGFFHFDQIAAWTDREIAWVDANLEGFKGRVTRDEWVKQATLLSEGGETEFSARVKKGDVY